MFKNVFSSIFFSTWEDLPFHVHTWNVTIELLDDLQLAEMFLLFLLLLVLQLLSFELKQDRARPCTLLAISS